MLVWQNQKQIRRWQHQYNKVKVFEVEARERKHNNQKLSPCEPKGLSQSLFLWLLYREGTERKKEKNERNYAGTNSNCISF